MDSSWLRSKTGPHFEEVNEGLRPGGEQLLSLVDAEDPAFLSIVDVLHEMRDAGADLESDAVRLAVRIGRHRHAGAVKFEQRPTPRSAESIVYYARRAGLVKIGTTSRPEMRFAALLPDEILAWEPGGEGVERSRHVEFSAHRVGGEFFALHEALIAHMQGLCQAHGEPDPNWPTLATVHRIRPRVGVAGNVPQASARRVTVMEGVAELGVKRNTVDMWVRRKMLTAIGRNDKGRPLYLLDHMVRLAKGSGLLTENLA